MKKINITIGTFLFFSMFTFSQNENTVEAWRNSHPSVLIIEQSTYNEFDETQKSLLKDFILIEDELTINDIQNFELQSKTIAQLEKPMFLIKDGEFIKNWIAQHPDIKILKQSYFQSLSIEKQNLYEDLGHLILAGEIITKEDLINYNNTH